MYLQYIGMSQKKYHKRNAQPLSVQCNMQSLNCFILVKMWSLENLCCLYFFSFEMSSVFSCQTDRQISVGWPSANSERFYCCWKMILNTCFTVRLKACACFCSQLVAFIWVNDVPFEIGKKTNKKTSTLWIGYLQKQCIFHVFLCKQFYLSLNVCSVTLCCYI